MNDKNLKLIVENKKPTETIQEIENSWDRELAAEEREIFQEIEIQKRTDEEGFYVAEAVEDNSENNLAHQPSNSEEEVKKHFLFKINLKNCYLADARTSWLFRNAFFKYDFEKLEEAQNLLQKLETGDTSVFSYWRGIETNQTKEIKARLVKKLQTCLRHYQNGGGVMAYFKDQE